MAKQCSPSGELTVCGLTSISHRHIKSKARCQGIPMAKMVINIIKDVVNQYPAEMKKPFNEKRIDRHLRVTGGAIAAKQEIINIADNIGVNPSDFMKVKIYDALLQMPNNPNFKAGE